MCIPYPVKCHREKPIDRIVMTESRTLGYERVYLQLCKVADTPFHINGYSMCSRQLIVCPTPLLISLWYRYSTSFSPSPLLLLVYLIPLVCSLTASLPHYPHLSFLTASVPHSLHLSLLLLVYLIFLISLTASVLHSLHLSLLLLVYLIILISFRFC